MPFKFLNKKKFILIFIIILFVFAFFMFKKFFYDEENCCCKEKSIKEKNIKNIGIIIDGNRRWAKKNGVSLEIGYRRGAEKLIEAIEFCLEEGFESLTVYALSHDNLTKRNLAENRAIFDVAIDFLNEKKDWFKERNIFVNVIGELERLPQDVESRIDDFILDNNKFCCAKKFIVNMLIAYGAFEDLLFGLKNFNEKDFNCKTEDAYREIVLKSIRSSAIPMIDLVIRTGFHNRLSGFVPMQAVYSELYFVECFWPDFNKKMFKEIIDEVSCEDRNFGM